MTEIFSVSVSATDFSLHKDMDGYNDRYKIVFQELLDFPCNKIYQIDKSTAFLHILLIFLFLKIYIFKIKNGYINKIKYISLKISIMSIYIKHLYNTYL